MGNCKDCKYWEAHIDTMIKQAIFAAIILNIISVWFFITGSDKYHPYLAGWLTCLVIIGACERVIQEIKKR